MSTSPFSLMFDHEGYQVRVFLCYEEGYIRMSIYDHGNAIVWTFFSRSHQIHLNHSAPIGMQSFMKIMENMLRKSTAAEKRWKTLGFPPKKDLQEVANEDRRFLRVELCGIAPITFEKTRLETKEDNLTQTNCFEVTYYNADSDHPKKRCVMINVFDGTIDRDRQYFELEVIGKSSVSQKIKDAINGDHVRATKTPPYYMDPNPEIGKVELMDGVVIQSLKTNMCDEKGFLYHYDTVSVRKLKKVTLR